MKMRFTFFDADKNGVIDNTDIVLVARKLAAYRNEGQDEEKRYYEMIQAISFVDDKGVTEEEFIERAKKFVSEPDAKERVKVIIDATFKLMDATGDGIVSYEEFLQFHKSLNVEQELIDKYFESVDINGDGVINYRENSANFTKFFFSPD